MTRAVVYRRVSTDDQLKGYSPKSQADYAWRYCSDRDHKRQNLRRLLNAGEFSELRALNL